MLRALLSSPGRCALLASAVLVLPAAAGQGGPSVRPINKTCVAPARPAVTYALATAADPGGSPLARGAQAGVLYRGAAIGWLQGSYLYVRADGRALMARDDAGHGFADRVVLEPDVLLLGLAEDKDGNVVLSTSAGWQRLTGHQQRAADFPQTLSATGCFDAQDMTRAASGLVPYAPAAPLWSDGATKRRWLAMPDWRSPDSQIALTADGDFDFPVGTVLVKEFSLGALRVETRLLVRHEDGAWAGYTYEWNDAQTDANLLPGFKQKEVAGQTWTFPSRGQCLACHSNATGRSIGPEIAQLNNSLDYGAHGVGNQLEVLDAMGLIAGGLPGPVATLDALPDYASAAPVAARARGYLHANCAMCHRPGGPGLGPEDFRYYVSGADVNALDVVPWRGDMGVPGALLLKRGRPEESVLWLRLSSNGLGRMPPLGVSLVDSQGVALVREWINSGSGFGFDDVDGDEYSDDLDNCSQVRNKAQRDTDGDGFGNRCDPDLNNDNVVNVIDLGLFRQRFFSNDATADFDGDGVVNVIDLGILRSYFFAAPGPGAVEL